MRVSFICLFLSLGILSSIIGQELKHETLPKNKVTAIMAYALLDNSAIANSSTLLVVPVIELNYDHFVTPKWGIGIHTNVLLQQFKVVFHNSDLVVERINPIGLNALAIYKPYHRLSFFGGYGLEFEQNKNLQLIKLGVDYSITLPMRWEVVLFSAFDYRLSSYGSFTLGVGFSKDF